VNFVCFFAFAENQFAFSEMNLHAAVRNGKCQRATLFALKRFPQIKPHRWVEGKKEDGSYDVKWLTPEAFRLWRNVGLRGFTFDGMPAESWSGRTEDRDVAFAAGMSRLSCRFCVLSSRADLVCSARLNPDLADRYAEVRRRIGHRFRTDLTMADVIAEARDAGQLALIPLAAIA
jgi:hypothetical protein